MVDEVNPEFIKWLAQATQCEVKHATLIQPLWSEQGACFRATLSPVGTSATKRVVAKCAQPRLVAIILKAGAAIPAFNENAAHSR